MPRKVDQLVSEVSSNWKKTYIYVTKKQVSTWKGLIAIFFVSGIFGGIAWSVSMNIETQSQASTGSTTLTWNANIESDLAGYKIYYGIKPRAGNCPATAGYSNILDAGKSTTYTISNLTEGFIYYFSVSAYDANKNESCFAGEVSKSILVSTVADTISPSVAITTPDPNAVLTGTMTLSATATDNIAVSKVDFYIDNELNYSDSESTYSYNLDTTKLSDGLHKLTAKAYDAAGNVGTSTPIDVTVKNFMETPEIVPVPAIDTAVPVVTITSPQENAVVSGVVSIKASATDNTAVSSMTCFVDGNQIGTSSITNSISCNWNTRKISVGDHKILIEAKDASGNVGSQIISVKLSSETITNSKRK